MLHGSTHTCPGYRSRSLHQPSHESRSFRQQTFHGGGSGGHCYDEDAMLSPADVRQQWPHHSEDERLTFVATEGDTMIQRDEQAASDNGSTSSMEDVDQGLEGDETRGEEEYDIYNDVSSYEPPRLYTQDSWSNTVDPSPPLPTLSRAAWDGTSEFFVGQEFSSKEELKHSTKTYSMQRNCTYKVERSSTRELSCKCNNSDSCESRLWAFLSDRRMSWRITKYNGPHTCVAVNVSQDHVNLDAAFISTRLIV